MNSFPKLSYACPIPWADLRGGERARFCEKCGHTIVNFSELTAAKRQELLERNGAEKLCVTYYRRLSGEYVTPDSPLTPEERSRVKQLGVAALSAGALALAAGCMSTPEARKSVAAVSPASSAPAVAAKPEASMDEAAKLARYDKNRNGRLDLDETAALEADRERKLQPGPDEPLILQPFGIVASRTPAEEKAWINRRIQLERRNEPTEAGAEPSSPESWGKFWEQTIQTYRNPRQIGGADPRAEEYARYIVSQRRKFRLPELKFNPQ